MGRDLFIVERIEDAFSRISEICGENSVDVKYVKYFETVASYLMDLKKVFDFVNGDSYQETSSEELRKMHDLAYGVTLPSAYTESFLNPDVATKALGEDMGRVLSYIYSELLAIIPYIYDKRDEDIAIRLELFIEVYCIFSYAKADGRDADYQAVKEAVAAFAFDYQGLDMGFKYDAMFDSFHSVGEDILMNADLEDTSYLYRYGEYVSDNELKVAEYINSLSEEVVDKIAFTYSEGYRKGFETTNKDISIKEYVGLYYPLGFERIVRKAVLNFKEIGLNSTVFRRVASALDGRDIWTIGFLGTCFNKQLMYDHSEDNALWIDKAFFAKRYEGCRIAFDRNKYQANHYGGPAVVETYGEDPFTPVIKDSCLHLSEEQQKLSAEFSVKLGALTNQYVIGEERSFTIISFPVPEIGDKFTEIFEETIKINTLDYELYRDMQQIIIGVLDKAEYVEIKGMGDNVTDLQVALHTLNDPEKETNFENCVADVNIPVGEVFTSPKLAGTNGLLNVTRVFLGGLEYKNLKVTLKDGCVADYSCDNFDDPEKGRKYFKDNVLNHHDTLPLGEFAIGTNTVAYKMAEKYDIADRLTILIAEKTGPHFALGDTCFSHEEEVLSYNPDGKRMIAKTNEISEQYKTDPSKAYFQCHTDITIPYDELGSLTAVCKNGERYDIILNGRFVLEGLEELNKPLDM